MDWGVYFAGFSLLLESGMTCDCSVFIVFVGWKCTIIGRVVNIDGRKISGATSGPCELLICLHTGLKKMLIDTRSIGLGGVAHAKVLSN